MIKIIRYPEKNEWTELLKRPAFDTVQFEQTVSKIIDQVKQQGDEALLAFTKQFDNIELDSLLVSEEEFNIDAEVSDELKSAIQEAKNNIEKFHSSQHEEVKRIETTPGVFCWRRSVAIQKVGLYVPGGTAPLFSTVLMLGIPAVLAGCKEITICTPPRKDGTIHPAILYTAKLIGVRRIIKTGGAQAIAAMAYGTESVPACFKIFGPGNQYVTTAKQLVNKEGIAIDMPAGPSEVAILTDDSCNPSFVAAELLSQAEHGNGSHTLLVSTDEATLKSIIQEVSLQIETLSRKDFAVKGLENSKAILLRTMDDAIDLINDYAPEHLVIQTHDDGGNAFKIENAGSVFLGKYTPVAAGDYCSGTNHTLPTNGFAKVYSGVALDSFVKKITFQHITQEGIQNIGKTIEVMASSEGLTAHKNSVSLRLRP